MVTKAGADDLYAQAMAAWAEGRREAAVELLHALVEARPAHFDALNTLGLVALGKGEAEAAAGWFERAAAAQPGAASIWFNHGQALEAAGRLDHCLASLDRALSIEPRHLPSILKKAELLEKLGRERESLALYRAIVAADPPLEGLPAPLRDAFARGVDSVRAADERRAAAIEAPLAAVEAAFPDADLRRARAYAEQRTGRRKVYVQQPVTGHFPYLPAIEFFPRALMPWLDELERHTETITAELLSVLGEDEGFRPYVAFDPTQPVNQWGDLNHSRRWSAWFFWEDGVRNDDHCSRCPATAAALEALPLLDLPGKGPTALFSILAPQARIPPHTGSDNVRATVHLPLIAPPGCGLRVGAETRPFAAGEAWAFDDTIEHEAWNDSDAPRAILILDAWNPLLSEAERAAVRAVHGHGEG